MKKKLSLRVAAISVACIFIMCLMPVNNTIAADKPAAAPTVAQGNIIREAADFLTSMGMNDMADNVRTWLSNNKIKIDPDMKANGATYMNGVIHIRGNFVTPLPAGDVEKFIRLANLAQLLLHEKTHAHQAPEGGALAPGVDKDDWTASTDVMKECLGPDPLEVEAYYKQIRAYLLWAQNVLSAPIPGGLTPTEITLELAMRSAKAEWLMGEVSRWSDFLKKLNLEKANKFSDLEYLADRLKAIDDDAELTGNQKFQRKIDILNELINNIFAENSFYDKCRDIYKIKKGIMKAMMAIPAIPGNPEMLMMEMPPGNGILTINGLPEDLDVGESELFEFSAYNFMIPPEPDSGYEIVSPVFLIEWNALSPVPFNLRLYLEGMGDADLKIAAFGLEKSDFSREWTILDTEIVREGGMSIVSADSEYSGMYAVVTPVTSYMDMLPVHWAFESTARLEADGVIDSGLIIEPGMEVPREVFVKYLVKALGLELVTDAVPFTDVDETDEYFPFISTAYHNNLTSGVAVDRFGMGEIIPREQSITFLIRAIGMEDEALSMTYDEMHYHIDSFFDITTNNSEWAYPYLAQAVRILMVEGYPDGTLRGKNLLSHAEVITLIDRIKIHLMHNPY